MSLFLVAALQGKRWAVKIAIASVLFVLVTIGTLWLPPMPGYASFLVAIIIVVPFMVGIHIFVFKHQEEIMKDFLGEDLYYETHPEKKPKREDDENETIDY